MITHPDKILFPKDKLTKKDLAAYYTKIASKMLPYLKNHPLVLQRYPNGITKSGFFQKNVPEYFPSWISQVKVQRKEKGSTSLVLCQNTKTLLYLVNQGCITFHTWLSSKSKINQPDRIVFDLDPPKGRIDAARKAALALKNVLEKHYKLKAFLMTTGSKGFHIHVPIKPKHTFNEIRSFAKTIAKKVSDENPKLFTTEVRKNKRRGRIFIDYLRNAYAQHAVAPYSVRPLPGAPIAMPISWKELSKTEPQSFSIKGLKMKANPWTGFHSSAKSISSKML